MAKIRSQQLNPNLTGSFNLSGSFIVTGSLHSTNSVSDSGSLASRISIVEGNVGAQDLNTYATPTFAGLNLTNNTSITGSLTVSGDVSGSSTSTGSFGRIEVAGSGSITGDLNVGNRIRPTGDIIPTSDNAVRLGVTSGFGAFSEIHGYQLNLTGGTLTGENGGDIHIKGNGSSNYQLFVSRAGGGGGVGIYTNTPMSNTLHVAASSGIFVENNISGSSTSTGSFGSGFFDNRVGINQKAPTADLHISSPSSGAGIRVDGGYANIQLEGDNLAHISLKDEGATSGERVYQISSDGGILAFNRTNDALSSVTATPLKLKDDKVEVLNISGSATSTGSFGVIRSMSTLGYSLFYNQVYVNKDGSASTPSINVMPQGGNGFYKYASNEIGVATNGTATARFSSTAGLEMLVGNVSGSSTSTGSFGRVETSEFSTSGTSTFSGTNIFTGNVGINSTNPTRALDVVGDIKATGDIIAENYIVSSSVVHLTQSFSSGSTIFGDTADDVHEFIGDTISGSSTSTGSFGKLEVGSQIRFIEGADSFINGGDFGIGTNTPVARLEIADNSTTNAMLLKLTQDNTSVYGMVIGNATFSTTATDGGQHILGDDGTYIIRTIGSSTSARIGAGLAYNNYKYLEIDFDSDTAEFTTTNISGSSTSTGSFGRVEASNVNISVDSAVGLTVDANSGFAGLRIGGASGQDSNLYFGGDTNGFRIMEDASESTLSISSGGSDRTFNLEASKIGINTQTPQGTLDVTNTGVALLDIVSDSDANSSDTDVALRFFVDGVSGTGTQKGLVRYNQGDDIFGIGYGSNDHLKINSSGNLEVAGNISGSSTSTGSFGTVESDSGIVFKNSGSYAGPQSIRGVNDHLVFHGGTDGYYFNADNEVTNHLRIDSAGKIGIGTVTPTANLHVVQTTDPGIRLTSTYANMRIEGTELAYLLLGDSGATSNFKNYQLASDGNNLEVRRVNDAVTAVLATPFKISSDKVEVLNISGSSTSTGSFGRGYFNDIGISQTNPSIMNSDADDLVIGDAASGVNRGITIYTSAGNSMGSIHFGDGDSGSSRKRGRIVYDHTGDTLTFAAANTDVLEVTNGGLEVLTGNISGSSTSTGSFGRLEADVVEAKQFVISSSVTNMVTIDVSGSTDFGDTGDDTHRFTGSIFVQSGSISQELHTVTNSDRMFFGRSTRGIPVSGSSNISRFATDSGGNTIDLGYTTVDGDGKTVLTAVGDGIHNDLTNYWYNNNFFRVGTSGDLDGANFQGLNSQYVHYDLDSLRVKGNIIATTGSLQGEVFINSPSGSSMFIGKFTGGIPVSGSDNISRYATGSDGSTVDLGFTTLDGDGNSVIVTTGDGIYVDDNNYWYTTGHFKVGSSTNQFNWNTTDLSFTGPLTASGDLVPSVHNTYDLGADSYRWANIYTADLQLSNENATPNEIDGTTGSWTIQEGEDDLYLLNRKNGKKYRFKLEEIE